MATSGFLGEITWKAPCALWALMNLAAVVLGFLIVEESSAPTISRTVARTSAGTTLRKMLLFTPAILTGGALYQITSYFGPLNLTKTGGWNPGDADLVFAIWIGIGTVTSYYFGAMSARFGRFRLLAAGYIASAVASGLLVFFTQWWLLAPVLIIYGAFLFVTYPALFSFITDSTVPEERGTAFGILFGFQLGGGALAVYICGIVADVLNDARYVFAVGAAISALSLITLLFWEVSGRRGGAAALRRPS